MTNILLVSKVILSGDKKAFGTLVDRYQVQVRGLLLKLTAANSALADDLAQETFIKAYLKIGSLKAAANFKSWLYRIAYHTYLEHCRSTKETDEFNDRHDSAINSSIEQAIDIYQALSKLKDEERICICMSLIEGFAHGDIASITGMPLGTVKTNINRGRKKLQKLLS